MEHDLNLPSRFELRFDDDSIFGSFGNDRLFGGSGQADKSDAAAGWRLGR